MQLFLLTFLILGLAIFGMALGVILNKRELKGSCGGLSNIPGMEKSNCSCSNPCEKRKARLQQEQEKKQQETINIDLLTK